MAGLQKVKGLPLQLKVCTSCFNHDDEEMPSKKRKLEEIATEEIPTEESRMSALDKLIENLNQEYPVYKKYREGTKYPYTTVQYRILDPEYILEPFTDAIRQPNGHMYEYKVYFTTSMTVLQYRQERKQHKDALVESVSVKPKTFLAFYMKWKRHAEFPDMCQYMTKLYGVYPPWMPSDELVVRQNGGFLNI